MQYLLASIMHNDEAVAVNAMLPTLWVADADVSSCTSILDWIGNVMEAWSGFAGNAR